MHCLFDTLLLTELVELVTVAVEHIDVYLATYAPDMPVGTQLPVYQLYVGLVFAIARYPYHVVILYPWRG